MDENDQERTQPGAAAPPPPRAAAGESGRQVTARRTERLEGLMGEALGEPDCLRANLKVAVAQLFHISHRLGDTLTGEGGSGQAENRTPEDLREWITTLMLVHRQITRYVQLEQHWTSKKPAAR